MTFRCLQTPGLSPQGRKCARGRSRSASKRLGAAIPGQGRRAGVVCQFDGCASVHVECTMVCRVSLRICYGPYACLTIDCESSAISDDILAMRVTKKFKEDTTFPAGVSHLHAWALATSGGFWTRFPSRREQCSHVGRYEQRGQDLGSAQTKRVGSQGGDDGSCICEQPTMTPASWSSFLMSHLF